MADLDGRNRRHIVLRNSADTENFTSPGGGGGGSKIPTRDRRSHGGALLSKVQGLEPAGG